MGYILKALGLTLWGLIGFGLLVVVILVGYEAVLRQRTAAGLDFSATSQLSAQDESPTRASVFEEPSSSAASSKAADNFVISRLELTHQQLRNAVQSRQYARAVEYGQELAAGNDAAPEELLITAQAYASLNDCKNADIWLSKAGEALSRDGGQVAEEARAAVRNCRAGDEHVPPVLDATLLQRMQRLKDALQVRAEADRARLPQLEADAAKSSSGEPSVQLGELYFGFADYEHAIRSLQRGLDKGGVSRLDEAYVYLGLSEKHAGNLTAARNAFARLKDIPGISPRVLRVWTLYADTQL